MAHILLVAVPFAGHAHPVAGVAAELVKRGHRVSAYTGERYRAVFEAVGCQVAVWDHARDFDETRLTETFPAAGRPGIFGVMANVRDVFVGTAAGQVEDISAIHAHDPIDIVAAEVMTIGASIAAPRLGVPWVTLGVLPLMLGSAHLPPPALPIAPAHGGFGRVRDGVLRACADAGSLPYGER